ncbi:MAG: hypothetical protein CFE40_06040 [Burkholderiales bacterium PBB1]|nr:MAG: hypothetical protein CFE40_06040 [Burkholderiales bacterium PBB1]
MQRLARLLAGLWAGLLVGLGAIGAPAGFAVATVEVAGRTAGRMFAIEAYVSLAVAVLLLLLTRQTVPTEPDQLPAPALNTHLLLLLGTLFCTIVGYFVLQPMMAAARAGEGSLSFGALHGLSAGFFALKGLLVLMLAWRFTAR